MLPLDHLPGAKVVSIRDRIRLQNWPKVVLPVAAAILIGVGLSTGLLLRNDPSSPPVFRQQQDEDTIAALPETRLLSRTDCRLRWTAGPSGARYDLLVTDGELEVLSTVKGLKEPEYTLPQEEIPASSDELFWRVTAHLPDGRTLSSGTFTTEIDDPASEPNR